MSIKQKTVDFLTEVLRFPFYSKQEIAMHKDVDSSQTSQPQQQETSNISFDPFSSYSSSQFGQQQVWSANKNDMLRKWREASYLPEVDTALGEISNEAVVFDEIEDAISINLSDIDVPDVIKDKMVESFENIMYMLDFNERGDELFQQWYVDGQLNIESVYHNDRIRNGIQKLILLTPFNFNTFVTKDGEKKFYYGEVTANNSNLKIKDPTTMFTDEQITSITSGLWSMDRKFPISYLNKTMKTLNQLSLIEDSLVILRITKSTEKRAFYINTGNLPKPKAEEYMRNLISKYRQKRIYNTESGTIENKNRSISILEDFWFPVNGKGEGTRVENIPGVATNFTSFEDVDYFVNKVYKALNIPISRRAPDSRNTVNNTIDIEKDELKFFKFILKLRRKFNNLFVDLMKKDLIAKKVLSLEDWNAIQEKIKFTYANSNEYSEIKNNQIVSMRVDAANSASQLVTDGYLSKSYVQSTILRLTDEEMSQIKQDNAIESADTPLDDMGEDLNNHEFGNDFSVRRKDDRISRPPKLNTDKPVDEPITSNTPEI